MADCYWNYVETTYSSNFVLFLPVIPAGEPESRFWGGVKNVYEK